MRELGGSDLLELHPSELISRRRAPFARTTERIPIDQVLDVRMGRNLALVAETPSRLVILSDLGDPGERSQALTQLQRQLRVLRPDPRPIAEKAAASVPEGWLDASAELAMTDPSEFGTALVSCNAGRIPAVVILGLLAAYPASRVGQAALDTVVIRPGVEVSPGQLAVPAFALIALAFLAALAWTWRREIRVRTGVLETRLIFLGHRRVRRFEGARLEIEFTPDSDGDPWYRLLVRSSGSDRATLAIGSDCARSRHLGYWLARRLGSELELPRILKSAAEDAA